MKDTDSPTMTDATPAVKEILSKMVNELVEAVNVCLRKHRDDIHNEGAQVISMLVSALAKTMCLVHEQGIDPKYKISSEEKRAALVKIMILAANSYVH